MKELQIIDSLHGLRTTCDLALRLRDGDRQRHSSEDIDFATILLVQATNSTVTSEV